MQVCFKKNILLQRVLPTCCNRMMWLFHHEFLGGGALGGGEGDEVHAFGQVVGVDAGMGGGDVEA